jgi:hypothetical protein
MHMPDLIRSGDSPRTLWAIKRLRQEGYFVSRPTDYQIKVGDLNFWPDKGTITRDGQRGRLSEQGLDALIALLPRRHHRQNDGGTASMHSSHDGWSCEGDVATELLLVDPAAE